MAGAVRRLSAAEAAEVLGAKVDALAHPDLVPLWKQVHVLLVANSKKAFDQGRDPVTDEPWPPLKNPSKQRGGPRSKPLRDTGLLMASLSASGAGSEETLTAGVAGNISEVRSNALVYGTSVSYAGFHQEGTRTIPRRRFLGIGQRLVEKLRRVAADFFRKLFDTAMGKRL